MKLTRGKRKMMKEVFVYAMTFRKLTSLLCIGALLRYNKFLSGTIVIQLLINTISDA